MEEFLQRKNFIFFHRRAIHALPRYPQCSEPPPSPPCKPQALVSAPYPPALLHLVLQPSLLRSEPSSLLALTSSRFCLLPSSSLNYLLHPVREPGSWKWGDVTPPPPFSPKTSYASLTWPLDPVGTGDLHNHLILKSL